MRAHAPIDAYLGAGMKPSAFGQPWYAPSVACVLPHLKEHAYQGKTIPRREEGTPKAWYVSTIEPGPVMKGRGALARWRVSACVSEVTHHE